MERGGWRVVLFSVEDDTFNDRPHPPGISGKLKRR